jgi:hypothetical protein
MAATIAKTIQMSVTATPRFAIASIARPAVCERADPCSRAA